MSQWGLTKYLKVSKDFDAQLEAYLLKDSERRERAETTVSMGDIQYHEAKVKSQMVHCETPPFLQYKKEMGRLT